MPAPRLSVILVSSREQASLRPCVSALLEQSFRDVEILVFPVGDPGDHRDSLAELPEQDDRLRVLRLPSGVDVGEAHDRALEAARGDYVWFLPAADRLLPAALAAVAERLHATEPDVLVVDHTREDELGEKIWEPYRKVVRAAPAAASFTVDEYPPAADLAMALGNIIFERRFLAALGVRFARGRYGHLTVTYPSLLAAERVTVFPRICSVRVLDVDEAGESADETLADIFARYEDVLRFLAEQGGRLSSRRRLVLASLIRQGRALLPLVPRHRRREFFQELAETFRRHAGGETRVGEGMHARVQASLVARGRYRSFRVVGWAVVAWRRTRARLALARQPARVARALVRPVWRLYYRLQLRAPVEPDLAVFAAYWYRGYACNPRAIFEKLRELEPGIRAVWVVGRNHVAGMPPGVDRVIAGTRAYYRAVARAKYFVNNVGFPDEIVKREGTVRVHTHHGTPLKTMGLDLRRAFFAGPRLDSERQARRSAYWDFSVSQNAFSTAIWERVYPGSYETLEVGYPRNDVLVRTDHREIERIRHELRVEPGRRTVLYAPTHREYIPHDLPPLDVEALGAALGRDYLVLARTHYLHREDLPAELGPRGNVLDVTRHPSIEELMLAADVLVTDYSSVMFDYAVLDRPIVVHAPDWEFYRALRGTYFDLLAEPPGVVARSDEEVVAALTSGTAWSDEATCLRAAFRARFCSLDDGFAATRVVRRVWRGEPVEARFPGNAAVETKPEPPLAPETVSGGA